MTTGKLYLIPSTLGENDPSEVIPSGVLALLPSIRTYVAEEVRTVRRYLSRAGLKGHIDELEFHVLNEHTTPAEVEALLPLFQNGDVGLVSEAGLPAVADPGSSLVALCHKHGIEVMPLVGPSSLMLALMASGLNGQGFAFRGYLPAKTDQLRTTLKEIEKQSRSLGQSEIFIETPYRNDGLLTEMLAILAPGTRLCLAADITLPTQFIMTRTVAEWRRQTPVIGKRPCVFIILA